MFVAGEAGQSARQTHAISPSNYALHRLLSPAVDWVSAAASEQLEKMKPV